MSGSDGLTPPGPDVMVDRARLAELHDLGPLADGATMLVLLADDATGRGRQIAAAADAGDVETAWRTAHALKGLAATLGAVTLTEAAEVLVRDGREGRMADATALRDLQQVLAATVDVVRSYSAGRGTPSP